jgi:SAM-dependent methyltransferase
MISPSCRACGASGLVVVMSLGDQPLSNAFVSAEDLGGPEPRHPLDLAVCPGCGLAQITTVVDPVELFASYAYLSSYSTTMVAHAEELVGRMIRERGLGPRSLATEIASNDGYLLQHYLAAGVPVLGIDPARNVVDVALARGVDTRCAFFDAELAEELRGSGLRASVLHANNVLAHVADLNSVVKGIARLLEDDGVAVIETPYVRDLVERGEFDTIYHEHLYYYSLTSFGRLLERNDLKVVDVARIPIHGGSLRVFAARTDANELVKPSVGALLAEDDRGVTTAAYFEGLADRMSSLRAELVGLLHRLKEQRHRIAAYGAAAKGTILLNTCGIGVETLDFVADRNPLKQGRFMPGVHVPIVGPERILQEMPDEVLVLAWNFADEIVAQLGEYRARGGRFVVPLPELRVVG